MKHRPKNKRLTSTRELRKKYFVHDIVKRGTNETWLGIRRWTGRVFKVLLLAAIAAGIYLGVTRGSKKFFWENPDYALKDIKFHTDGSLTRKQAIEVTKLKAGVNIFTYKTAALRDTLRTLPQVESAEVVRYLPNRIEITVRERRPAAWLVAAPGEKSAGVETRHLLDASGIVFLPRDIASESNVLPVISGVQTGDLEVGKPIRKAEVVAALDLLKLTREPGALQVTAIDVSRAYCLVATDQRGAQLTFGLDDIPDQLDRLEMVRSEAKLIGEEIQTINLIPMRNIPVTFMLPPPKENDDAEEQSAQPAPGVRSVAGKARTGADAPAPAKDREKGGKPARKREEPKPSAAPRNDGGGLLKRFRTA